jgi:CubicO group peptidase (beta-lactamase class C family)
MRQQACRLVISIAMVLLSLPNIAQSRAADADQNAKAVREWLDANVPKLMARAKLPGFSIAVVRDGTTIYSGGFGARDPAKNLPATADTLYGIGSVTKSFVAIGIMQLAEQGKLKLDDPVSEHVPFKLELPGYPITIHHLLTHTSGLPNLGTSTVNLHRGLGMDTGIPFGSADDFYRFVNAAQNEIVCKPGERYFYNNAAWRMLAHIVQEKSGMPFHMYIKKNVLDPLGMSRSTLDIGAFESDADHIVPHLKQPDGSQKPTAFPYPNPADNPAFSFIAGAGGITSSVNEMTRYLNAQIELGRHSAGALARAESFRKMHEMHFQQPDEYYGPTGYGYGLSVTPDFFGHKMLSHGGSIIVSTAYMAFIPDLKLGVIMMGNSAGTSYATIAESVFALLMDRKPEDLPENQIKARRARLVGEYETYRGLEQVKVVNRDGMLYLDSKSRLTGATSETPLVPDDLTLRSTTFTVFSDGTKSPVEFQVGDDGKVKLLVERSCYHKKHAGGE